jgi:hypothetical protein
LEVAVLPESLVVLLLHGFEFRVGLHHGWRSPRLAAIGWYTREAFG